MQISKVNLFQNHQFQNKKLCYNKQNLSGDYKYTNFFKNNLVKDTVSFRCGFCGTDSVDSMPKSPIKCFGANQILSEEELFGMRAQNHTYPEFGISIAKTSIEQNDDPKYIFSTGSDIHYVTSVSFYRDPHVTVNGIDQGHLDRYLNKFDLLIRLNNCGNSVGIVEKKPFHKDDFDYEPIYQTFSDKILDTRFDEFALKKIGTIFGDNCSFDVDVLSDEILEVLINGYISPDPNWLNINKRYSSKQGDINIRYSNGVQHIDTRGNIYNCSNISHRSCKFDYLDDASEINIASKAVVI